jgi:hypothetical protein
MRPETGKRPRNIAATARLSEAQCILRNLHDRRFNDEVIADWLRTAPENIARWRTGRAAPTPGTLASLRPLGQERPPPCLRNWPRSRRPRRWSGSTSSGVGGRCTQGHQRSEPRASGARRRVPPKSKHLNSIRGELR